MPEYRDTVDDFNLKWSSSFARYKNEPVYVYGAHVMDEEKDDSDIYVQLSDLSNGKSLKIPEFDLDHGLEPLVINSHLFNSTDFSQPQKNHSACLHIRRLPRRQNKRGICTENVSIYIPFSQIAASLGHFWQDYVGLNSKDLKFALNCVYPNYAQALALCHDYYMVAISPNFAVALSSLSSDKYLFASRYGFIGEADQGHICIHHKGSLQEVRDFITRNNLLVSLVDKNA